MNTCDGIDGLRKLSPGTVMSIGNFDGLHLGHARILEVMKSLRDGAQNQRLAVVTFEPHPLTVLKPELAPPRLTAPMLKRSLLEAAGVDDYVVLPPTRDVLGMEAEEFWRILRDEVRPAHLVEGQTFNFGRNRRGNINLLRAWSSGSSMKLHVIDPVEVPLLDLSIVSVSSSLIRWLLAFGRVRDAAICLGRPYVLEGLVVEGFKRGRTIGTPTINLKLDDQHIPADGVYAGRCAIDGKTYPAAVSIGNAPTFEEKAWQIEAHLIGFSGDLYGRTVRLEMIDWLRDQRKFPSLDLLKKQISIDVADSRDRFSLVPARAIAAAS